MGLCSSKVLDINWPKAEVFFGDVFEDMDRARFLVFALGLLWSDGSVIIRRYDDFSNPSCYFGGVEFAARDKQILELIMINWVALGGRPGEIEKMTDHKFRLRISSSQQENVSLLQEAVGHVKEFCHDLPPRIAKLDRFLQNKIQPKAMLTAEFNQQPFTAFVSDPKDPVMRVFAQDLYRMDIFCVNPILVALGMPPLATLANLDQKALLQALKKVSQLCAGSTSASGTQRALAAYYKNLTMRAHHLPLKNLRKSGFPCPEPGCTREFVNTYALAYHRRPLHGAQKHKCDRPFCNVETMTRRDLKLHKERCHTKNKKHPKKVFPLGV